MKNNRNSFTVLEEPNNEAKRHRLWMTIYEPRFREIAASNGFAYIAPVLSEECLRDIELDRDSKVEERYLDFIKRRGVPVLEATI